MKIGIPRALLYYYYYPFWKILFQELGLEIVVSSATNKSIVNKGVEYSVAEICVPIKVFAGHVASIIDEVDYVFIPRMMSISKGEHFCPKFMGLPDVIRYTVPNSYGKILSPNIYSKSDDITDIKSYKELGEKLGVSYKRLSKAVKRGKLMWEDFRKLSRDGYILSEALDIIEGKKIDRKKTSGYDNVTIGLLGYVYNIYDEYVNMGIIKTLREMNVDIWTFEMLNNKEIKKGEKYFNRKLFWTFSNKLMASGYYFYNNPKIHGIIHVTAFGCGPDSLLGKALELDSDKFNKPFMTIRVDEHSGESHLQTRVEAFIDMIKRKRISEGGTNIEGNLSIHGVNGSI